MRRPNSGTPTAEVALGQGDRIKMAINWKKYGLVAKPGPEGGPYIIEPKTWEQIEEFLAELKAHDEAEKFNKVVIAVDFKNKTRKAHKEDPDMFWKL